MHWDNFSQKEISDKNTITLLGYACDEGVGRNLGRIGAKLGPDAIRKKLAKQAFHFPNKKILDLGNLICENENMEDCQNQLAICVSNLITHQVFPIILGGGHDIAYGHFIGIRESLKKAQKNKLCIVNFDAHFDLRPVQQQGNSGTPFYQILTESKNQDIEVEYVAIGIQKSSNTPELFDIAKQHQVTYILNDECYLSNLTSIQAKLAPVLSRNEAVYITIDLDGFSSAYAPGVSAPSPMGFDSLFCLKMLEYLMGTQKVISCDIAELNPRFDLDDKTATLAAKLIDSLVSFL